MSIAFTASTKVGWVVRSVGYIGSDYIIDGAS